tara:strand:- start:422 stop:1051 length:630 start_codon:yes stop_codon:yes gene_type:complete
VPNDVKGYAVTMDKLILAVGIPLMLLNGFGGIAAFIWLVILGNYWFLIGAGFIALLFSSFALGLLMLPSTAIQFAGIALIEKKQNIIGYIFMYLGNLLLLAAFSAWILYVYYFGLANVQRESHLFPVMLWCYGVATGPIFYMANKEKQSGGSTEGTDVMSFFISIGCFAMTFLISFFDTNLLDAMIIFIICVFISINLLFYEAYKSLKR